MLMKKMFMFGLSLLYLSCFASTCIYAIESHENASPWGVAAHPLCSVNWWHFDTALKRMKEAGITWIREDFKFNGIAKVKGKYNFKEYDEFVERCTRNGIKILPILEAYYWEIKPYRPDATPMHLHPDEWRKFVRAVVGRYHNRIKYWEIWNEEDGGFWKPAPKASEYVPLLKIAYEEIKKIDPDCRVMVGGLSSWPSSYLKNMYENGAHGYFDAIAIHQYGWGPDNNKKLKFKMEQFKKLMASNNDSNKEIWITESGASTNIARLLKQQPDIVLKAIYLTMKKIGRSLPDDKPLIIGAPVSLADPQKDFSTTRNWLPPQVKIIPITPEQLKKLSPSDCPVMIGTESTHIEEPYVEPMRDYVKRGGILLAFGSVPFYISDFQQDDGTWNIKEDPNRLHPFFRIGFEAWWTDSSLPHGSSLIKTCKGMENEGIGMVEYGYASRFLSRKNLLAGDSYTPIIQVYNSKDKLVGEGMAIYTYHDWKGAILACTIQLKGGVSESQQANLIQRMYLSYLASGIKKIFVYDLHSDGKSPSEKEHNFGILRWDWTPKPAFVAYKEMTRALGVAPQFVRRIEVNGKHDNIQALVFRRIEDGKSVLAIWATGGNDKYKVKSLKHKREFAFSGCEVHFIPLKGEPDDYSISVASKSLNN